MKFSVLRGFIGLGLIVIASPGWMAGEFMRRCALPPNIAGAADALGQVVGLELLGAVVLAFFTYGLALVPAALVVFYAGLIPFETSRRNLALMTAVAIAICIIGFGAAFGQTPLGVRYNCGILGSGPI